MYPFYNFCQFFTIFGYIFPLTQKLRCTKEIYDLDDSFAWKCIIIRSVYSNYPFEILSKSIFEIFFSTADNICMIITDIPLKKNVTSEKMPLGVWISHQIISSMPRWFDEKISKIPSQNQKLHFFLRQTFGRFLRFLRNFP